METAEITGAEFDARHPNGHAWRAAGRPDYGFRAYVQAGGGARGWMAGLDYEDMSEDYETIRAWCYGTLEEGR